MVNYLLFSLQAFVCMPNYKCAQQVFEASKNELLTLSGSKLCVQIVINRIFMAPVSRFNVLNLSCILVIIFWISKLIWAIETNRLMKRDFEHCCEVSDVWDVKLRYFSKARLNGNLRKVVCRLPWFLNATLIDLRAQYENFDQYHCLILILLFATRFSAVFQHPQIYTNSNKMEIKIFGNIIFTYLTNTNMLKIVWRIFFFPGGLSTLFGHPECLHAHSNMFICRSTPLSIHSMSQFSRDCFKIAESR